ncbi:nuclear transport factor 2 family protein [Cupriavidus necator]|uniref:nuclear transport factor 2 family protein n=1 Tax=Cupriavidus necator TaxID=106590 RepID=UPI00068DD659|nr:nuclear transport factor 2 family protein [Cupriavidus necator]
MTASTAQEPVGNAHQQVLQQLQVYLDAIYDGDAAALRSTFHPDAQLFAEVRGEFVHKPVDAYLQGVASRRSPASQNEPYGMSVLSVEVIGRVASANVLVRVGDFNYYNFLSLLNTGGQWVIVNKLYTHVER